ncbi:GFA family protein [Thalassococcus sp. CAU 1522]|uniref:GFA family protein n=1 Tax=Thalassococcus arenae TaxID=2851652 RepID=A0ABS6N4Q9_9RHOB|nr:GFA family protein [Thalassococcus arenae]MBV2358987.1 GFA family protein [Thalassococcus arenae]
MIEPYRRTGKMDGQCLCGAVRIAIDGEHVAAVGVCHCQMCQRWTGGVFACFGASAGAVTVSGPVVRHKTSDFAERAFCGTCGSNLWMRDVIEEDADFELMPGLFPEAQAFPLISEIYTDRAPAYGHMAGDHVRATRAEYEAKHRFVEGEA